MRSRRSPWISLGFYLTVIFAAFVFATPASAQCNNSGDTTAPCFANNPDILGGKTSLLRNDDLTVNTAQYTEAGADANTVSGNLLTQNSNISQQSLAGLDASPTQTNALTLSGRLFNADHDHVRSDRSELTGLPKCSSFQ
jgi:hypothetical protein